MTAADQPGASRVLAVQNRAIMPTAVRCVVETGEPVPLVRLVGVLDLPAAESVRAALLTCLADRDGAVIVDLSQLDVRDPAAVAIFAQVAQEAADCGGAEFLLCRSHREPGGWMVDDLPVAPSIDQAVAWLQPMATPRTLAADLEPVVGSAREARQLVTDGCAKWDLPALTGPACIVVTELVNNAVVYAKTRMTLRLALRDGALHAAVRDYSRRQPAFRGLVSPTSTGGRGLLLIDTIARRWGSTALDDGKVVWAVLDPEDHAPD
jgi:anti-anti-sigma regulatory factor